jgi:hypothetical protein
LSPFRISRRFLIISVVALALLLSGAAYFLQRGRSGEEVIYSPILGAAGAEEIAQGSLGLKYLTRSELKELRLKQDLSRVKYLKGLDLGRWAVACERGIDCIPQIEPEFQSVLEADEWLGSGDLVLSVQLGQTVKAYPLRVIAWHQVVNDYLGDVPVIVTYCPFTGAGLAYKRPLADGKPLEFGVSGRLYNANILLYDRETGSLWQQFTGEVIAGPLLGLVGRMEKVYADIVPWGSWKRWHPGGLVLARPQEVRFGRRKVEVSTERYEEYPYAEYELREWVGYGVDVKKLDLRGLFSKRRVVGVIVDRAARAYLKSDLEKSRLVNDQLGGEPILAVVTPAREAHFFSRRLSGRVLDFMLDDDRLVDKETGTVWDFDGAATSGPLASQGTSLEELSVTPAYWFAWVLFRPETDLSLAKGQAIMGRSLQEH